MCQDIGGRYVYHERVLSCGSSDARQQHISGGSGGIIVIVIGVASGGSVSSGSRGGIVVGIGCGSRSSVGVGVGGRRRG